MAKTTNVELGLVENRHQLPVADYIFSEGDISFPINPNDLLSIASKKFNNLGLTPYKDIRIIVYATGLTPALTAVIRLCFTRGFFLTVKHYDKETGDWIDDIIFDSDDWYNDSDYPAWLCGGLR